MFVYNLDNGVNFAIIFFRGDCFLRIMSKPAKIAKIKTRKNVVLQGICFRTLLFCQYIIAKHLINKGIIFIEGPLGFSSTIPAK